MGTLPIMTVGSEELLSSLSILSYLAGVAGKYPTALPVTTEYPIGQLEN